MSDDNGAKARLRAALRTSDSSERIARTEASWNHCDAARDGAHDALVFGDDCSRQQTRVGRRTRRSRGLHSRRA